MSSPVQVSWIDEALADQIGLRAMTIANVRFWHKADIS
jgi:hypothetical protein